MADKNTPYSDIWAQWSEMDTTQRKTIGLQMFSFLRGASLSGVVEILSNAPLAFKKAAWEAWASDAYLSGYLLGDVVSLQETETPTIAYSVVKQWLKQADLSRANEAQIAKMASVLTTREDKVALWLRWAGSVDLTMYDLPEFAKLLSGMYREVAIAMNEAWLKDNRVAVSQIRALNHNNKFAERLEKMPIPPEVIDIWAEIKNG